MERQGTSTPRLEPLECMPEEMLRQLEGLAFDVDDTLTRHGVVEREAYAALWDLHEAGVHLLALTGRPLGYCEAWARTWPVDAVVGENGAGWVARKDGGVLRGFFATENERLEYAQTFDRVRARVAYELPEVRVTSDDWARRCDLAFDVGEDQKLDDATVARLVSCIEAEGARAMVSTVHAHAVPGAWDKASGAEQAARQVLSLDLAARRARWLFVGDSGNDAAAFAWFEHTVGVANVRDHLASLPVPPRWITRAGRGRGFAELAQRVLHGR
jgi:HAD superfamily hydrolase (TIGR01484 family)